MAVRLNSCRRLLTRLWIQFVNLLRWKIAVSAFWMRLLVGPDINRRQSAQERTVDSSWYLRVYCA